MDILLAILFLSICILLIIAVLLQKGKGQGLSGAFGGMGQSAFGTRVGDVFTWITIVLVGLFLLLAIISTRYFHPEAVQLKRPWFTPAGGVGIDSRLYVRIEHEKGDAEIHYTDDGGEPTRESFKYDVAVRVTPGMILKARAYRSGWITSDVAVAEYPPIKPELSPAPGVIKGPVEVTITCADAKAKIYYTIDGGEPPRETPLYTGPMKVTPPMTAKTRAYRQGPKGSDVVGGEYTLETAKPPAPATASAPSS